MAAAATAVASPTLALAAHAAGLRYEDLPEPVRDRARVAIADTVGAALHGRDTEAAAFVHAEARERHREGPAVVWGRGTRLVPAGAALVNATQAHAFENDDYHPQSKSHPGAVVVSAALAAAPPEASGRDLIAAIAAGYDVMVRVCLAAGPGATRSRGWHLTGVGGPLGAAATAGRLRGLDQNAMARALGIAASCSGGLFAFTREGAMTKRLHPGRAAEAGIVAADLAARGFTGPTQVLEEDDGGLLAALGGDPDGDRAVEALGERFELSRTAVKPYCCCGSIHSSLDALLDLRRRHDVRPADVAAVVVRNSHLVLEQCGFIWTGDGGELEAQMSLQYCLAAALLDGRFGPAQLSGERREDPAVRDLAARVELTVDPEVDAAYPRRWPAKVDLRLHDGSTLESAVDGPRGTPERPSTDAELDEKFMALSAAALAPDAARRFLDAVASVEDAPATRLAELLAAPQPR